MKEIDIFTGRRLLFGILHSIFLVKIALIIFPGDMFRGICAILSNLETRLMYLTPKHQNQEYIIAILIFFLKNRYPYVNQVS